MAIQLPESVMDAPTKEEQWERIREYLDSLTDEELWKLAEWDEEGINDFFLALTEKSLSPVWNNEDDDETWGNISDISQKAPSS